MGDLIDRIAGSWDLERPKINVHRWIGAWNLYVSGVFSRSELASEFDLIGYPDELRQATQIADNLDANPAGLGVSLNTGNVTWTNMPAGLTELFGVAHRRAILRFEFVNRVRLVARVSTLGTANAILFAQYSTDESAWSTLSTSVAIGGGSAGTRTSTWSTVPSGAGTGDIYVRVVGQDGDGQADPVLGNIMLQMSVPWDKDRYMSRIEGVFMCLEDSTDTLFHTDGVVNKSAVFSALQIAG